MQRETTYTFGRFQLDTVERRLLRGGQPVSLTPKVFDTLLTLVQHAGHAVSKDDLMRAVWPDGYVEETNLSSNISTLRKVLGEGQAGERYIETVPKLGYRFVMPVASESLAQIEAAPTKHNNLPGQLTRFIGREREVADVIALVQKQRLVTLTGSGGVGKTRLATEAGAQMLDEFAAGVWLAVFAPLTDPAAVPAAVAGVFHLQEQAGRSVLDGLITFIGNKRMLLIFDNCEHLIASCAELAEALLRACPNLHILATSREALRVAGEANWRVPSMDVPAASDKLALAQAMDYDAVLMFIEHAALKQAGFTLTPDNLATVVNICRRLDGIPLAIEMAATQLDGLDLREIEAGLVDRFDMLTSGSRTAVPRHQTLRATLDWSYNLLNEPEQRLLARLSVFRGGFTADAAQAVCEASQQTLLQLVRKSLLTPYTDPNTNQTRYRLLETVRQYADDRLVAQGEFERAHDRHCDYFVCLAERAEPELRRTNQVMWLNRLECELDNLRATLEWMLGEGRHVLKGLKLATTLLWLWHLRQHKQEGIDWLERAMAAEASERGEMLLAPDRALACAGALNVLSFLKCMQRRYPESEAYGNQALVIARELGKQGKPNLAFALSNVADAVIQHSDVETAITLVEESLTLYQELGDKLGMAQCYNMLGQMLLDVTNDSALAREMHEKSVALRREIGDADGLADSLSGLVKQAHRLGDYAEALRIGQEVLEIFLDLGNIWAAALALGHLSFVALDKGDYEDASRYAQRQLKLAQEVGEPDSMAFAYLNLGRSSNAQGQYEEAKAPLEQARNIYLQLGNPNFAIFSSCVLASVLLSRNRPEQASRLIDDAHQMAQSADKPFHVATTHYLKGHLALIREDYGAALHSFQESLAEWGGQYLMQDIIYRVDAIASVATYLDQATLAAQLFGAINERYPFECHPMAPFEWELHNRGIAAARAALGDAEFEAAYAAGQRMSLDEAIALARCH